MTDTCTGLMWQRENPDKNGDGRVDLADGFFWCEALRYCDALTLAGHDDWRLPNIREPVSIADHLPVCEHSGQARRSLALLKTLAWRRRPRGRLGGASPS